MSPEQAHDSGRADIRSDIYSLGCTFYHMLAGHAPFNEGSLIEKVTRHANVEPPDIRGLNPDVPDDLVYILGRTLRKDPDQRYQTPLELLHDLLNPEKIPTAPRLAPLDKPCAEDRTRHLADDLGQQTAAKPTRTIDRPKTARSATTHGGGASAPTDAQENNPLPKATRRPSRKHHHGYKTVVGWIAASVIFLSIVALAAFIAFSRDDPVLPDDQPTTAKTLDLKPPPKKAVEIEPAPKVTVEAPPAVPRLYAADVHFDPAQLQLEFEGPLAVLKAEDPQEKVLTVSRFGGKTGVYATLAEAIAAAPERGQTVIVVADDGPLFVPSLAPIVNRDLTIRAAKGFKPLIVWEAAGDKGSALIKVFRGSVVLENLELVVKWTDPRGDEPAAFVQVSGGDFVASHCTFSANGKHPRGFAAVRLDAPERPGASRLTDCYVRGPDMTALSLTGAGWDAQIDDCLLVTGRSPLVDVSCAVRAPVTVRVLRSTLVAGQDCFVVRKPAGNDSQPALKLLLLDSLLAHSDNGNVGNLLTIGGALDQSTSTVRVANCVYAGWTKLLASASQSILGTDLVGWQGLWKHDAGERASVDVWPTAISPEPEESPASMYATKGGPAYFAAISSKGLLGSPLDYHERPMWLGLTYERFGYPALALPTGIADTTRKPILLTKDMDLAQVIAAEAKPGQKLILKIFGSGEIEIRPIVVKGFDLTLCFDTVGGAKDGPLTLRCRTPAAGDQEAMFDVEGGSLEMGNIRVVFPNRNTVMPRRMFRLKGADLRLHGCWLQGPLDKAPPSFRTLIEFAGSGAEQAESGHSLAAMQTALLAGPRVIEVHGIGTRVRMQQCLVVAARDAFDCRLGPAVPPRLNIQWLLERSTFAVRRNLFGVKDVSNVSQVLEPMVVQAEANVFANPFIETPRTSCMLAMSAAAVERGVVLWQGAANAYDAKRWQSFLNIDEASTITTHAAWQQLWGKMGERDGVMVAWPATPPSTFAVGTPQIERLRLPGAMGTVYGADLTKVGSGKKK